MGIIARGLVKKFKPKETKGTLLKRALGIEKFQFAYVQRVINSSIPIYIITVDSKFPNRIIAYSRLKKATTSVLKKVKDKSGTYVSKGFNLTPPIELDGFSGIISSNSLVLRRDLISEYYANMSLYEKVDISKLTILG